MRRPVYPAIAVVFLAHAASAQTSEADLAKQLANPVSSLISVPLQSNLDCCIGPKDALRYTLNIQPVVPLSITPNWNLIVRTILPVIDEGATTPGDTSHLGLGDITQSFFFSPTHSSGIIWGVGPAFLWPVSDPHLAAHQWAIGPTFVVLKQIGPLTVGMLANQLWSYARDRSRDEVNATFMQPFLAYNYANGTTISINTETSYDWAHKQATVPIDAGVSHIYKIATQRVQLGVQGRFFAASPDGPGGGGRFVATFLFPK